MDLVHKERNGGSFTACALCHSCMSVDVHGIRLPNPNPPRIVHEDAGDTYVIRTASGEVASTVTDTGVFDRWDERAYEIVRICVECGYEWGQT